MTFPLNFCPGITFAGANGTSQTHITPDQVKQPCIGTWGIAIKEWEVIKQVQQAFYVYSIYIASTLLDNFWRIFLYVVDDAIV